jgi:hypothetical protein
LHEIKHDGYRIIARKEGDRVRLWSRNGRDWSEEFTAIGEAMRSLPDCVTDGEACAHCDEGLPDFWRLRGGGEHACLFAFDLLSLNGEDWKRRPLIERKARLKRLLGRRTRVLRSGGRWARSVRARLPLRAGGHHLEAEGFALWLWSERRVVEDQEPQAGFNAPSWITCSHRAHVSDD